MALRSVSVEATSFDADPFLLSLFLPLRALLLPWCNDLFRPRRAGPPPVRPSRPPSRSSSSSTLRSRPRTASSTAPPSKSSSTTGSRSRAGPDSSATRSRSRRMVRRRFPHFKWCRAGRLNEIRACRPVQARRRLVDPPEQAVPQVPDQEVPQEERECVPSHPSGRSSLS